MNAKRQAINFSNTRLRYLIAVLFLLGLGLAAKLYWLQVVKADFYISKANKQQQVATELLPNRGKIWVNNYSNSSQSNELSLLATSRNFASIYSVPKDLSLDQANFLAEKLMIVFGAGDCPEGYQAPTEATSSASSTNRILSYYMSHLQKPNDPYEVLIKKAKDEDLLRLYGLLLNISPDTLEISGGKVYKKEDNGAGPSLTYKGLGFELIPQRYYPEGDMGGQMLGFVNYDNKGNYGLEEYYNKDLQGQEGYLKGDNNVDISQVVRVGDKDYIKPQNGSDLVLTIDRAIQFFVCKKLAEGEAKYKFDNGTIIVVDPKTGAIIAICTWPDFDPNDYSKVKDLATFMNPAVSDQYEPGSVFKSVTMAAALDQGKITPQTTYNDPGRVMINGWPKPISNSDFAKFGGHGITDMTTVLNLSLNTGAIFAMEQIGAKTFSDYVHRFGFGQPTNIDLSDEATGDIRSLDKGDNIKAVDAATASFGQGITVTPIQMVMAYAAIANNGILMRPYLVREIIKPDNSTVNISPQEVGRVISEQSARTLRGMLGEVVEKGHSHYAGVKGYYVGGKTGTAQIAGPNGGYLEDQFIHTFIGMTPIDDPKFVMLIKLDKPKGIKFAESTAAPMFGEIADFLLKYYQIPKER